MRCCESVIPLVSQRLGRSQVRRRAGSDDVIFLGPGREERDAIP
jgi:hypothetical protein